MTKTDENKKISHRKWKALKRKHKRQAEAQQRCAGVTSASESEDEAALVAAAAEHQRQHELWLERERKAQEEWAAKKEREKREYQKKLETEQKIREEWEERQKKEKEEQEERDKNEQAKKEKQVTNMAHQILMENLDIDKMKYVMLSVSQLCVYRTSCSDRLQPMKTRCSRSHPKPDSSTTLMFPGMFANFRLEQSLVDENDTDLAIEYDDSELYQNFKEFYDDVLPEFRTIGRVVQFKVSSNCESHLRGNVYVQFKSEEDAHKAFIQFNGRWYGGRQLSCEFVKIEKWKAAICGLAFARRCPKGKSCNFLHVFRNPGNEFWQADKDINTSERHRSPHSDYRDHYRDRNHHYRHARRDSRHKTYHRSRSRSPSTAKKRKFRSRSSRSRSPSEARRSRSPRRRKSYRRDYNSYSRSRSRSKSRSKRQRSRSRSPSRRSRSRSRGHSRRSRSRSNTRRSRSSRSRSHSRRPRSKPRSKRSKMRSRSRSQTRPCVSGSKNAEHEEKKWSSTQSPGELNGHLSKAHSNGASRLNVASASSDSDSDFDNQSVHDNSKTDHQKKDSKHKKHKHKHKNKKKKKSKKGRPEGSDDSEESILDTEFSTPNIIEIPKDGEVDIGDVIFEDVYV